MSASAREIRVQIDSRIEFIDLIQQMAEDVSRAAGLRREALLNVGLAVREAVVNAITHGNRQQRGTTVDIVFRLEPKKLVVIVRDRGAGFDVEKVSNPLESQNIFRTNGRGIFFMRSFVDDIAFSRRNNGGTEVVMEKQIVQRQRRRRAAGNAEAGQGGRA